MKLILSKVARDCLETLPPKSFRQVVISVSQPFPHDSRQLKGSPYHRVDIEKYRLFTRLKEKKSESCSSASAMMVFISFPFWEPE